MPELRHQAMNQCMSAKIEGLISKHGEIKNFIILCGDSHLLDIEFGDEKLSLSLPTLLKAKYHEAEFQVIAQQCQSLVQFNSEFAKDEIKEFSQGKNINYHYIPWKERITDQGYSDELSLNKIVLSNEASLIRRNGAL